MKDCDLNVELKFYLEQNLRKESLFDFSEHYTYYFYKSDALPTCT